MNNNPTVEWVRARSPQQIEQRRLAILVAAQQLFTSRHYEDVSLSEIARQAGFTKSNVYRYYSSREEIFLALVLLEFRDWCGSLSSSLRALSAGVSAVDMAGVLVGSLAGRAVFLRLLSLLETSIERNSSEAALLSFKLELKALHDELLTELARLRPSWSFEDLRYLLVSFYAEVKGLWPMTQRSPMVERVMSHPELTQMCTEFEPVLIRWLGAAIAGLDAEHSAGGRSST